MRPWTVAPDFTVTEASPAPPATASAPGVERYAPLLRDTVTGLSLGASVLMAASRPGNVPCIAPRHGHVGNRYADSAGMGARHDLSRRRSLSMTIQRVALIDTAPVPLDAALIPSPSPDDGCQAPLSGRR